MRIAYLDCFSGMSGDMFMGAIIDAGVPARVFEETVAALDVGARLEISKVNRSGITATKADVYVGDEKELPREVFWEQQAQLHAHHDEHGRNSRHSHAPEESRARVPGAHRHGRSLNEIKATIRSAKITSAAKNKAIAIFEALGIVEAKVHNTTIEEVHFHEVGAVDAMVDIVCAAVGSEALEINEWVCSPLNVGSGTVKCAHGVFPVPAPATVELLKDAPVYSSGLPVELVTPTGAAIVKVLARRFGPFPQMKILNAGYGAGTRDFSGHANVVRLTVGESQPPVETHAVEETISILEANLDDLNPQVFGYVMDRLLEEGALDAFGIPVQMKKNRPGILLTVLARVEDVARLTKLILAETTTLGVRRRDERRQALQRRWVTVTTRWGDVRMKIASLNGTISNYAPEYEDCRQIASERRVPLKTVMQEAVRAYLSMEQT
jgi:pyridinium-3,5-bisthiocarboxylic acid mononucleotide nickel chelatase